MPEPSSALDALIGQLVALDLQSQYVCLGTLVAYDHRYLILEQADVHDLRDTTTTREKYMIESRIHGIHSNRERVLISHQEVVSISRLDDIIA